MRFKKNIFFVVMRFLGLFIVGMMVAVVVALSRVNLETLRGNVLTILRDATGLPVEIDGKVAWKFSMRPKIELNQVRVANESWAKSKYAFSAKKIDVRLNLISLFRDRPTIQNVRVYDADINIEKNADGHYSLAVLPSVKDEKDVAALSGVQMYPFKDPGLGGVEIRNINANLFGKKYTLAGFNIRSRPAVGRREYSGWIKAKEDVLPFVIQLSEYNSERRIYPVQVALATGGDALIANVALEGTSKMPIDFIIKGEIPAPNVFGKIFALDFSGVPGVRLNVAGGFDHNKLTLRKSSVLINGTNFTVSGGYDWSNGNRKIKAEIHSPFVELENLIPGIYVSDGVRPNRELNVFKDIPLFGEVIRNQNIDLRLEIDDFDIYKGLDVRDLDLRVKINDSLLKVYGDAMIADGDVDLALDGNIDVDGRVAFQAGVRGEHIIVGEILKKINHIDIISDLAVNLEVYVQANGKNLSEVMQTITGPVVLYSVQPGYAHSTLVSYMYGTDFLTSLRHSVQDLFSSEKKYDQIKISCVALNANLRNGVFETENGVAVETNAINVRLAGMLDLGKEEMQLSLTTVPVRGLKLSLTGKVVNSIELTGSLAEPDIKISGAAVASKVASATGIGLLLAPFTGGIGLVAGTGVGLIAGDLLENWLADDHPCETALERGAKLYRDDPEWFEVPVVELVDGMLENRI